MTVAPAHIGELFAHSAEEFSAIPVPQEVEEKVQEDIGALDRMLSNGFIFASLLPTLYLALDLPLIDVFKSAWKSTVELQEYHDLEKHPAGETTNFQFGKHKIVSKHRPNLEVLMNGKMVGSLTFDVKISLSINATTLVIRDARIWQASGTEFRGEAELSYKGFRLVRKKIGPLTLPGTVDFKDGIAIPALPAGVG